MSRYTVVIVEATHYTYEVDAECDDDAEESALEEFLNGNAATSVHESHPEAIKVKKK